MHELAHVLVADRSQRIVELRILIAKLTKLRKRGLLPTVGKTEQKHEGIGFSDINEVAKIVGKTDAPAANASPSPLKLPSDIAVVLMFTHAK